MHPASESDIGIREGDLIAGKYRVDRVLGTGGMGVVVAARHLRLEELVAIKLLLPDALADADAVRRFEREARAAVKIKSEHVARILDVGTLDSGAPFIVMEYLDGEDLADRIARTGPLSVEDAIELLLQACEAIAEAHALGIVHRDLKPANLFCVQGADGRTAIKVLDFGISKLTRDTVSGSGLGMTKTTHGDGLAVLHVARADGIAARGGRADRYLVAGHRLLSAAHRRSSVQRGDVAPSLRERRHATGAAACARAGPTSPMGLEAIALRCLEKDPNKRFATVAALATALARFGPRRAQVSLDRITRTWRHAEARLNDGMGPRRKETSDRPVTGPIPSWGGTAKSLGGRTRSILGWVTGVILVLAIGVTLARRQAPTASPPTPAVLITPPAQTEQNKIAREPPTRDPLAPPLGGSGESVEPIVPAVPAPSSMEVAPSPAPLAPQAQETSGGTLAKPFPTNVPPNPPPAASRPAPPSPDLEPNPYGAASELPARAAAAPTCVLNLNAMPAAKVVLDGRPLGFTPKVGMVVPAGEHRVYFRWEDGEKHETATCAGGETKTVAVRLYDPSADDRPIEKNPYR